MPFFDDPHTRRLRRDHDEMLKLKKESTVLDFKTEGDPPEHYDMVFHGKGIVSIDPIKISEKHMVSISLGVEYPRSIPSIRWETGIYHPNISGGRPCLGNFHMSPYVKLTEIVEILWDMCRLAIFNPHSAYQDASTFYRIMKEVGGFPVDPRIIRDKSAAPQKPEEPGGEELVIMGSTLGISLPGALVIEWGKIFITPGAARALDQAGQKPIEFLQRHFQGDWGEILEEDVKLNEEALQTKDRVMSAYTTKAGEKIWVITDAGHEVTTILLPEEY